MPFKNQRQRRACYAKDDPDWNCKKWEEETPEDLPEAVAKDWVDALDIIFETPLTTKQRGALDDSSFALPNRRYPIHDRTHAANALARVSQHGTASEKATVRRKVYARYPDMGDHDKGEKKKED